MRHAVYSRRLARAMGHALLAACVLLSVLSLAGCSNCAAGAYASMELQVVVENLVCQVSLMGTYRPYNNQWHDGHPVYRKGISFLFRVASDSRFHIAGKIGGELAIVMLEWNGKDPITGHGAGAHESCAGIGWQSVYNAVRLQTVSICLPCPANSISPQDSTEINACQCNAGFSGADGSTCTQCVADTYKSVLGSAHCENCPSDTMSPAASTTENTCKCNAGFTGVDGGPCSPCGRDTYKSAVGSGTCVRCHSNSSSLAGSTTYNACVCDEGYATDPDGTCRAKFTECVWDYNATQGDPACFCAAGYTGENGNACSLCSINKYKEGFGPDTCSDCPSNSSSPVGSIRNTSCECNAGYMGANGASCAQCGGGTYKEGLGSASCVNCPFHKKSRAGSITIKDCQCNRNATMLPVGCMCNDGYAGKSGDTCTQCGSGTYKAGVGSGFCLECPSQSSSPAGSITNTACLCNAGYTGPNGTDCTECVGDTYKATEGPGSCLNCPSPLISQPGSTTSTACIQDDKVLFEAIVVNLVCSGSCECNPSSSYLRGVISDGPGRYPINSRCKWLIHSNAIISLKFTTFSTLPWMHFVVVLKCQTADCQSGPYVQLIRHTGKNVPVDVFKSDASYPYLEVGLKSDMFFSGDGFTADWWTTASISDFGCIANRYDDSALCQKCPPGSSSPVGSKGNTSCVCNAGFDGANGGTCAGCPAGTYKIRKGHTGCAACPANSSSSTRSTALSACMCNAGWQGANGRDCVACAASKYKEEKGNSDCVSCPANSSSPASSTAIIACRCDAGWMGANDGTCVVCAVGTYRIDLGSAHCVGCPANSLPPNTTTAACLCNPGWTGTNGNCTGCRFGEHKAHSGPMPCTDCKVGEYSELAVASTYCVPCPAISAGWSGRKGDCASCVPGKYKESPGSSACTDCEGGKYLGFVGADAADDCTRCPDHSSSLPGSDNVTDCVCNAGFSKTNGECACDPGSFLRNETGPQQPKPSLSQTIYNTPYIMAISVFQCAVPLGNLLIIVGNQGWPNDNLIAFDVVTKLSWYSKFQFNTKKDAVACGGTATKAYFAGGYTESMVPNVGWTFFGLTEIDELELIIPTDPSQASSYTWTYAKYSLSSPRRYVVIAQAGGWIAFCGGEDQIGNQWVASDKLEILQVSKQDLIETITMPRARKGHAVASFEKLIIIAGGCDTSHVDIFNTSSYTFTTLQGINGLSLPRNMLTAVSANSKAYFAGGEFVNSQGERICAGVVDMFDMSTMTMTIVTPLAQPRTGMVGMHWNGNVYFGGGTSSVMYKSPTYALDVYADAGGHHVERLTTPRMSHCGGVVNDKMLFAFGQVEMEFYGHLHMDFYMDVEMFSAIRATDVKVCVCNVGYSDNMPRPVSSFVEGIVGFVQGPHPGSPGPCVECEAGKFAGIAASAECERCPYHSLQPEDVVRDHCLCNAGFYGATCTQCETGKFRDRNGPSLCEECPVDSYIQPPDQSRCRCNGAGMLFSVDDGGSCTQCAVGTFLAWSGATACDDCGVYAESPAQGVPRDHCVCIDDYDGTQGGPACRCAGRYRGPDGGPCVECGVGTYHLHMTSAVCQACPTAATSPAGSTSITSCQCNAGYIGADGGQCTPCGVNTYNPYIGSAVCQPCQTNAISAAGSAAISACTCPVDFYLSDEVAACLPCPLRSSSPAESLSLTACVCDPGFTRTDVDCIACVSGKYKPAPGPEQCIDCPPNSMSSSASTAITDCSCNAGWMHTNGDCSACVAGKYKLMIGSVACTLCAPGKYSVIVNASTDTCSDCAAGSYSTDTRFVCLDCPPNSHSHVASVSLTACICNPGWTGTNDDCLACVAGKYKLMNGSAACTLCAPGKYSEVPNASTDTCSDCAAGSYSEDSRMVCVRCPANSDLPVAGVSLSACRCNAGWTGTNGACSACVAGKYKRMNGSAACTYCAAGKYSVIVNATTNTCSDCAAGLLSEDNRSVCVSCPANSISADNMTKKSCKCNAGYTGQDGDTCARCGSGTYKVQSGSASCIDCPSDSIFPALFVMSLAECYACAAGTYATTHVKALLRSLTCQTSSMGNYYPYNNQMHDDQVVYKLDSTTTRFLWSLSMTSRYVVSSAVGSYSANIRMFWDGTYPATITGDELCESTWRSRSNFFQVFTYIKCLPCPASSTLATRDTCVLHERAGQGHARVRRLSEGLSIPRSSVRFRLKTRQLKFTWI